MNPNNDLLIRIEKLEKDFADLNSEVYLNNFSASQDFNKKINFNTRLKVPHYASVPSVGEVGEIIEVSGKLYICSASNTYVVAGTQS